ncbi:hypothetical protein HY798_01830 [Candidatus Falkowbacteria bacterium]|nr:hypothetical protein [Candidatus Falkowbacteria bacterium]
MTSGQIDDLLTELFKLSESRGSESAGIAIRNESIKAISVYKRPVRATEMVGTKEYKEFLRENLSRGGGKAGSGLAIIGHSRLVTNGSQEDNDNNQPVIKSGGVAVHNGIIVNVNLLWEKHGTELERKYEVDTEILVDLLRLYLKRGKTIIESTQDVFGEIYGATSVAVLMDDSDKLLLATNTGSLYYVSNFANSLFLFASEKYIVERVAKKLSDAGKVRKVEPFTGMLIDMGDLSVEEFGLRGSVSTAPVILSEPADRQRGEESHRPANSGPARSFAVSGRLRMTSGEVFEIKDFLPRIEKKQIPIISFQEKSRLRLLLEFKDVSHLKRCSRCILPETMPFIEFDEQGVCNYCRNYKNPLVRQPADSQNLDSRLSRLWRGFARNKKVEYLGEDKLFELAEGYRSKTGESDCIVPLSGGRDSCYGLHYVKTVLKMNPIAFTYDWGMVTDLARRNQARLCGKLGVEHILLSADIRKKRDNIRKNVLAWLKKPNLGIIPLFMAGDKQVHHYVNKLKGKTGVKLNVWSVNRLETTDFKVGFCGIPPFHDKDRPDYLPAWQKARLAAYYLRSFLANPSLFNSSVFDTLEAYYASYFTPRPDHYRLYDFVKWDENAIVSTLLEEYDWETSPDTKTTWRIGDGTAPFYNYIYYTVAGFTESDTFRSNQIREGMLNREMALEIAREENRPRFESIKWYCDTIEIDFEKTILTISAIPKLYRK